MDDPRASPLRDAMTRRLYRRAVATGQITVPAVPGMIDEYLDMCRKVFADVGVPFSDPQLDQLRAALESQLTEAFAASPRSSIVIAYESPSGAMLNYRIRAEWQTVAQTYDGWVTTRQPPLFGVEPDARVWMLAGETDNPGTCRVLDIGAGTGRNAVALARRGHPVDAVEMTPRFARIIRDKSAAEGLDVRVVERDVFAADDDLRRDYQLIVLSEVVSDFRTTGQLRSMFEIASRCLTPGGRLVFNAFVARRDYVPDSAARELGQQCYTSIFTSSEIADAAAMLPLELLADDSVYEYESANLPLGVWPPTGWYADWVSGRDVFDVDREESPIEMRWLVYRKRDSTRIGTDSGRRT